MKNFYFVDIETGEDFIVEAKTMAEARHTADGLFGRPRFIREIDDEEAEMLGVDTY
jgi:hypothetical protein